MANKGKLTLSKLEAITKNTSMGICGMREAMARAVAVGGGRVQRCFLTVSRDVKLDEVLEVLDVRRQSLDLVIAQPKLAKPVETEEILQKYEGLTDNEQIRKLFNNEDSFLQGIIGML